jgi:hypothetical protein
MAPTAVSEAWLSTSEQPFDEMWAERLEYLLSRLDSGAADDDS